MPRTSKDAADTAAKEIVKSIHAMPPARTAIVDDNTGEILDAQTRVIRPDGILDCLTPNPLDKPYIPSEGEFGIYEFREAGTVYKIANNLLESLSEFSNIRPARFQFLWKLKGGKKGGKAVWGKANKASGLIAYFSKADFIIWIAADHCADAAITNFQLEALIYHELKHCWFEIDENENSPTYGETRWTLREHDVTAFHDEVTRYGTWTPELRRFREAYEQLALKEAN